MFHVLTLLVTHVLSLIYRAIHFISCFRLQGWATEQEYVGADTPTPPPASPPPPLPKSCRKKNMPSKGTNATKPPAAKKSKQGPTDTILVVTDPEVIDLTTDPPRVRICQLAAVTELLQARLNIQDLQDRDLEQMLQMVLMQQDRLNSTIQLSTLSSTPVSSTEHLGMQTYQAGHWYPNPSTPHKQYEPSSHDAATSSSKRMPLRPSKTVNNALPSSVIKKEKLIPAALILGKIASCRWRAKSQIWPKNLPGSRSLVRKWCDNAPHPEWC